MKFLVHVADFRGAYIVINAKDREHARKRAEKLAETALDQCDHCFDVNAFPYDDWKDEAEGSFTEAELKRIIETEEANAKA